MRAYLRHVSAVFVQDPMCVRLQVNVTLIVLFNYYYTFLQLDPKDMADQLKRAGGAIPAVRPGRATADYITKTLNRMSILGSAFLGALAAAPPLVETVTGLQVMLQQSKLLYQRPPSMKTSTMCPVEYNLSVHCLHHGAYVLLQSVGLA